MKKIKILFTSVGRRVELMQVFRAAAHRLGLPLEIWGADMTETAPALCYCDRAVKVCRIKDDNYIPMLLDVCEREGIDALIPTIDTDLLILSRNKRAFERIGTLVLVSDEDKVAVCRDKRFTADYFESVGLKSPHPVDDYRKYDGGYPAFIKPKDGSSSIGAHKVENSEELKAYSEQVPDYIIQPFIGGVEYTVDIFCDTDGSPIHITPRIRQAVRAGEVLKTMIVNDARIIEEVKCLIADFKPCGAITVQLIRQDVSDDDYYIEINPRFGGGAPLSIMAGADSAEELLRMLSGEKLGFCPNSAADGAVFSRFDQSACITHGERKVSAVVFDLDDTLYSEKDFVRSGYRAVAKLLPEIDNAEEKLWSAFVSGRSAIDTVLSDEGIYTDELRDRCLLEYRGHFPEIELYDGACELLADLRKRGLKLGIITDGRPLGQRNKIKALGLENMVDEIIVTDEIGGVDFRKPNDISFRIMQRKLKVPFEEMVYVGDNLSKDLHAPRQLGMQAIWFKNTDGVHPIPSGAVLPEKRIDAIVEVAELIK